METRERPIVATLAYYGALRWPLTFVELRQHQIPGSRVEALDADGDISSLASVLESLVTSGVVRHESGLFVIGDRPLSMREHRVGRYAENARKWRDVLRTAWWFQAVPFVRMLAASGSLAMGSTGPSSDWDAFVVAKAGRLYTARLGLLVTAKILGRLRTKRMRTAPDRYCFNHLITTDGLSIRHRGLFTAHALSWHIPFYDPWEYAAKLRQANAWVHEYVIRTTPPVFERRSVNKSRLLGTVRRAAEMVLNTFIGGALEYGVRRWMQRRIEREPATHERGGRIVADERELEFHPRSFESVALSRYNATLTRLGMGKYVEHDSGLNR